MSTPWLVFTTSGAQWQAEVSSVRLTLDTRRGGAPTFTHLPSGRTMRLGARLFLDCTHTPDDPDYQRTVEVLQENDPAPRVMALEEGPERAAVRVLYSLIDAQGHYHGDGLQEIWLGSDGEVFLSLALRLVDASAHSLLRSARVQIECDPGNGEALIGGAPEQRLDLAEATEQFYPFGAGLPGRSVLLPGAARDVAAVYWHADAGMRPIRMDFNTPPFYHRWPDYLHQWGGGAAERRGWAGQPGSGLSIAGENGAATVALHWLRDAQFAPSAETPLYGLLALSFADMEHTRRRILAHQSPLKPSVEGGEFIGYDEIDGACEVRKLGAKITRITFSPSPDLRRVRVRLFALQGDGAVTARVNGSAVQPQLISYGNATDDPLAPVRVRPHGAADEAILSASLSKDAPTEFVIEEGEGIHASYQMRDDWRSIIPRRTSDGGFGDMEFSLLDGRARALRQPGNPLPAIAEHPLFWLLHCGNSPSQYINSLSGFTMMENGPQRVAFHYASTNLGGRIRNDTWVNLPYDPKRLRMEVRSRFTPLTQWDHPTIEFYDTFPFATNDPSRWFYDRVLFIDGVQPPRILSTRGTLDNTRMMMDFTDRGFFAFLSSDRGNILTLVRRPRPADTRMRVHLCGCWIDLHLDVFCPERPLPAGRSIEVETLVALHGDASTTEAEILEIARRSLAADDLLL